MQPRQIPVPDERYLSIGLQQIRRPYDRLNQYYQLVQEAADSLRFPTSQVEGRIRRASSDHFVSTRHQRFKEKELLLQEAQIRRPQGRVNKSLLRDSAEPDQETNKEDN